MKKILLLLLFSFALFGQTIKVTALPEAKKIDRADLLLLTQPATGTPVSKKMSFQTLLDSAKVIISDYTATIPPLSTSMLNSTVALELPLFHDARVAWQDSINSAFEKIDDKTIFFDENDFTLDDDNVLQLNDILAIDTLMRVNTLLSKDDTSLVTGKGIADYVKKSVDSLNTLNKMTNVAYKGQSNDFGNFTQTSGTLNATSALQLNGTSINTTGTLSKVAYKEQDNAFKAVQSISGASGIILTLIPTGTSATENTTINFRSHSSITTYTSQIVGGRNTSSYGTILVFKTNNNLSGDQLAERWRIAPNGYLSNTGADGTEALDVTGNIKASGTVTATDHIAGSANYFYFGASGTDGSWRIGRSGNNLVFERRESGSWVTKQTMTP